MFKNLNNPVSYAVQKRQIVSRYAKSVFFPFFATEILGQVENIGITN